MYGINEYRKFNALRRRIPTVHAEVFRALAYVMTQHPRPSSVDTDRAAVAAQNRQRRDSSK
jgi:hypothetical protein